MKEETRIIPYYVLGAIYVVFAITILVLRGWHTDGLPILILQGIVSFVVLIIVDSRHITGSTRQIDSYYTTAANALIGFGMILSALTILHATASGGAIDQTILSTVPLSLGATATGLATGTFFFVLGHIRIASADVPRAVSRKPEIEILGDTLGKLTDTLVRQGNRLEELAVSLGEFGAVVASGEGRSWLETQSRLIEPLSRIANAIDPHGPVALEHCASMMGDLDEKGSLLLAAFERQIDAIEGHQTALQSFEETLKHSQMATRDGQDAVVGALGDMRTLIHNLDRSISDTARILTTEANNLRSAVSDAVYVGRDLQDLVAEDARAMSASAAAIGGALTAHTKEIQDWRMDVTTAAATSRETAESLRVRLQNTSEALENLRMAITAEQRGLLDRYLNDLATTAVRIAEGVMQQVPPQLESLLKNVDQQILATINKTFDRAYQAAGEQFTNFNESTAATAERLKTIVLKFDDFNRALDVFDKALTESTAKAGTNATSFVEAATRLSDAASQFTDTVARNGEPENAPLLVAMQTTVEKISRAAEMFDSANQRLTSRQEEIDARQAQINSYYRQSSDLRAKAARLRIKDNGAS